MIYKRRSIRLLHRHPLLRGFKENIWRLASAHKSPTPIGAHHHCHPH